MHDLIRFQAGTYLTLPFNSPSGRGKDTLRRAGSAVARTQTWAEWTLTCSGLVSQSREEELGLGKLP